MFTANELLEVAEVVAILTARYREQAERYEKQQAEHRASFEVRTTADAKIIAGLREESAKYNVERDHFYQREGFEQKRRMDAESERDGLLTQVQNMRAEIKQRAKEQDQDHKTIVSLMSERDGLRVQVQDMREEIIRVNDAHGQTLVECDALRAEVAALQERLRASITRGDFAQMEVAALKSQNPKQHPVKAETVPAPKRAHPVAVGGYLRRLTGFNTTPAGEVARVTLVDGDESSQLEYEVVRPNGQKGRWSAKGCEPCDPPEATHDTEAGKASAESALEAEPVADEIKVGDVVEVVSNTGGNTWLADVGSFGTVTSIETLEDSLSVRLKAVPDKKNVCGGYVSICDVRKVTT